MKLNMSVARWCLILIVSSAGAVYALRAQPPASARPPQLWAVVIGISNYIDPQINDSPSAADQAGIVSQWFRTAGWDDSHLLLLRDFGARDPGLPEAPAESILPVRNNLNWAIDEWLLPRVKAGDLVVFYYAGQTGTVATPRGPQVEPRTDHYLLPIDARRNEVATSGWSLNRAVDQCALRRARVVCWLGTGVGPSPLAAQPASGRPAMPLAEGQEWLKTLTRWPGVTAWLASSRPMGFGQALDPSVPFTSALIAALGSPKSTTNLAACLRQLQRDGELGVQGFQVAGRVPPGLNLWRDEFGKVVAPAQPEVVLQTGHAGKVTSLACSADNRWVFSGSEDSTVRAWSLVDGALFHVWNGQTVGVTAMGISRDDRWLVLGGGRGMDLVADLSSFNLLPAARPAHGKRVDLIAMLPDGNHFISVDRGGRAAICDLRVSPLDPKPWPAEDQTCLEVVSGGKDDRGTVAARFSDGSVRLYDSKGGGGAVVPSRPGRPSALAVSPDGRTLAVGYDDGKVLLRDTWKSKEREYQPCTNAIRELTLSSAGWIAIAHENGLRLMAPVGAVESAPARANVSDLLDVPVSTVVFSGNSRYVAAASAGSGTVTVWRLDGENAPQKIHENQNAGATVLALTADGRTLIRGGVDGRVSTFILEPDAAGVGNRSWSIAPNHGKVVRIDGTKDHRYLLVLTDAFRVRIWDLKDRTCRLLRDPRTGLSGIWTSAVFLDEDSLALTAKGDAPEYAGKLVRARFDRDRDRVTFDAGFFARSGDKFKIPDLVEFEGLTLSPDGTRIAAGASPSQPPLVCVWETKTGRLTHWANHLVDPVQSLSFSTDGKLLLTAGDSPAAQLWRLDGGQGELKTPEVTFAAPAAGFTNVTCAAIRPGINQVLTGHSDGQVNLWSWKDGKSKLEMPQLVEGAFAGKVKSLVFLDDGKRVAAAGDGTIIWLGSLEGAPGAVDDLDALRPHHFEQINSLLWWKEPRLLVSASDDTTVRFWDMKRRALWGTLSVTAEDEPEAKERAGRELDWVFYTPDGFFDASSNGQKRIRFHDRETSSPMERFEDTHYRFRLADDLLHGEPPRLANLDEPPPISIVPPIRPNPNLPETELTVTLGDTPWTDVALFHNGKPIAARVEKIGGRYPAQFQVKTRLVKGQNRFAVMAALMNKYMNSLSDEVVVQYDGPATPSRVHVVALGVGDYDKHHVLKYSQEDASRIGEVLNTRGLDTAGNSGLLFRLTDDEVKAEKIEEAFDRIALEVENRPQDKVVVFLAGHTGVLSGNRFCLLLPQFPFPPGAPARVAMRGSAPNQATVPLDPRFVLPYSIIAMNLARLNALDRLVIVDACQAESILDDEQVVAIQKMVELGARKTRTSYLMAARRGEPAFEVDPLRHGLFTYTLLRGLGAVDPAEETKEIKDLRLPPNADSNSDGILGTGELISYVNDNLKVIASVFPDLVVSRQASLPPERPRLDAGQLAQHPVLQSFGDSFPLVPLVAGKPLASQ